MRKSTNTGFLIDDVGLLKFARCVERFCQNSKLTVLLYHNEKGVDEFMRYLLEKALGKN